ncbi:MAG: winged helix-turn-helix transcriptional regulator [Verrucomicrobiales bacterium]|nr:winged helix-turn-helix transcriptional regulator [Verrucomicrobiales bacterium]
MFSKVFRDIAKPQWLLIINALKRSQGLSVAELAKALKMSYMGVKQHCVAMEKKGYLDTWRRPKSVGRPEKAYRLTAKVDPLFPTVGYDMVIRILKVTERQIGSNEPERLLFGYFQDLGEDFAKQVKGKSVIEKASSLAKAREKAGYLSECLYDPKGGLQVVEYHNPMQPLFEQYPTAERMEENMFERLLGVSVERRMEEASGLKCYIFQVTTL